MEIGPDTPTFVRPRSNQSASQQPPAPVAAASARDALAAAVEAFRHERITDFRAEITVAEAPVMVVDGTDHADSGWEATTTLSDHARGSSYVMEARSTSTTSWMQMRAWTGTKAGCWLQLSPTQVPLSIGGLTVGEPGYISVVAALRTDGVVDADRGRLAGSIPLDYALTLASPKLMSSLDLDGADLGAQQVPLTITLRDSRLAAIDVTGRDMVKPLDAADVSIPDAARPMMDHLAFAMTYEQGSDRFEVRVPKARLVATAESSGCR